MKIYKGKKDTAEDCLAGASLCLALAIEEAKKEKMETKSIEKVARAVLQILLHNAKENPFSKMSQILKEAKAAAGRPKEALND